MERFDMYLFRKQIMYKKKKGKKGKKINRRKIEEDKNGLETIYMVYFSYVIFKIY